MSIFRIDTDFDVPSDRRLSSRRKEDYFWLKRLADLTGEVCLVVNRNMLIQHVDDKVFDLLQIDPIPAGELIELKQLTRIMAEKGYFGQGDPKIFEALISDLLINQRLKKSATQIINAVTPTGQHITIRISIGRDDSYLLLLRDCTEDELKKQALNTALKVGQSGYWYYNLRTRDFILRADSLMPHFSKESFEKIQKDGFMDVVHPDDRASSREAMNEAAKTGKPVVITIRIIGDDGAEHWIKSHVMPNVDEGGKARSLCCFFTTITAQMKIEQDLREAQENAELALKAKNEFLGRLSHEVRTPLNAVIGMADALVHNCPDETIRPQLILIQSSAEKVMEMVDGTLEHTKLADDAVELNLRECSPGEIVSSVCKKWQDRAKNNKTHLTWGIHPDTPKTLEFDDYRYEQCLSNLLSNAIKFTPGGKIKVALAPRGKGPDRKLVLAVRDNGIGMTEDGLSQIFLPFKQADKSISSRFGGTGLGLSIVKDLVELMGGHIDVNSKPGKGTLFAISIPAPDQNSVEKPLEEAIIAPSPQLEPNQETSGTVSAETNAPNLDSQSLVGQILQNDPAKDEPYKDLRVLIVDDNATNHLVVSSLLSRVVGEITTALNGQEALEQLKSKPFDLVLMDIHMPVMDGIETTLAIRSEPSDYQNVPIIALTADPQYQQARLCRNIGMNSSLGKPIKLTGLLQAFDEVLTEYNQNLSVATAA